VLLGFDRVLGLIGEAKKEETLPKGVMELIEKREQARKAKEWSTADALRTQLKSMGIVVEDTQQGVRWRIEKS
jgi:cysteinyl-tRNA synthetase